jgi:NAD(P)-dependent dehydrogenase (short-subunit alcohol dehydrogenase family)
MTGLDGPLRRGHARVVNVASDTLNDTRQVTLVGRPRPATLDLTGVDDLAQLNPAAGFVPFEAYARAKLMTVTAGYALARDLAADEVTVHALHPGIVATGIIDDLIPAPLRPFRTVIRRRLLTPAQGAESALRLVSEPRWAGVTGRYFNRDIESSTPPVSHDLATQQRLLALSEVHFAV